VKRVALGLAVGISLLLYPACGNSARAQQLQDENAALNQIIEFDRDVQVALAVYLNRNIAPGDRAFLCAVLHTKAAKTYFQC